MTKLARNTFEIERLDNPPLEVLERDYIRRGKPVILTGVANRWPASEKWSPEYFKSVAGDAMVRVPFERGGNFFSWFGGKEHKVLGMRFGDLLEIVTADEHDPRYYMTEQPLGAVSQELLGDVDLRKYVEKNDPAMFLGRGTFMPLHFHDHAEALLCQIHGDKEVTLFSPKDWRRLYAHPWYKNRFQFSRVDPRQPNLQRFPRFSGAKPIVFTLAAGEILYIPVNWWHSTACPVLNYNITFFWPSKLRHLNYPWPGLQYHAHNILSKALAPVWYFTGAVRRRLRRS